MMVNWVKHVTSIVDLVPVGRAEMSNNQNSTFPTGMEHVESWIATDCICVNTE